MTQAILALDLGTTGNRAVIYGKDWQVLASYYQEFEQFFPKPGWVEHDALQIWESALKVITEVLAQLPHVSIGAMGITNQRETVLMWDKVSGNPIHNAIVWQCRRTTERCQELKRHEPMIRAKTGLPLDPYFSATKIEWLLTHVPEATVLLEKNQLCCGTIDSWILWKLTGGSVHATDESNASRTMLMNIQTGSYDAELLTLFNIPETILPAINPSDVLFGYTDETILGRRIPITGILGDQQAALFAQCGENKSTIKNTYGTGLFVVAPTTERLFSDTLISTIAWNRVGRRVYALEGSVFVGGSVIQWIRDHCRWIESAWDSSALAESVSDTGGVYFVPALTGLGAPHWVPEARGTLFGLTRGTQPAHIVRAALESLAFQTADVLEEMQKLLGTPFDCLYVDGGACKNNFLMQCQADMLGIPVQRPINIESTAKGIAGFAALSAGLCTEADFRNSHHIETSFNPCLSQSQRQTHLNGWKKAVTHAINYAKDTL